MASPFSDAPGDTPATAIRPSRLADELRRQASASPWRESGPTSFSRATFDAAENRRPCWRRLGPSTPATVCANSTSAHGTEEPRRRAAVWTRTASTGGCGTPGRAGLPAASRWLSSGRESAGSSLLSPGGFQAVGWRSSLTEVPFELCSREIPRSSGGPRSLPRRFSIFGGIRKGGRSKPRPSRAAVLSCAPDQGKGVRSSRRPATVIGTTAAFVPLSFGMGRRGQ